MRHPWRKFFIVLSILAGIPAAMFMVLSFSGHMKPFRMPTSGMAPTLEVGDHLYCVSYFGKKPKRGDVIVFSINDLPIPNPPGVNPDNVFYVKRLIGLPGDQLQIKADTLQINGETFQPPDGVHYLPMGPNNLTYGITVPKDSLFVLGDNSPNSSDSRIWGSVPKENLLGKATLIYWPPSRAGNIQ
ncbi:MAG: signal peptidase I [Verrucomicrobiota bacterium]